MLDNDTMPEAARLAALEALQFLLEPIDNANGAHPRAPWHPQQQPLPSVSPRLWLILIIICQCCCNEDAHEGPACAIAFLSLAHMILGPLFLCMPCMAQTCTSWAAWRC